MTTRKLRAAVIGVGVGWNHIEGYQTCPDSELIAICDANPTVLAERGPKFNVPESARFTDYKELLKREDLDAVSLWPLPPSRRASTCCARSRSR